MPFLTLSSGLTIKVPTRGTTNWDTTMLTDTFQKISEHDHSGSGKGSQLGAASITDNAIIDSKIRLRNAQYLRARNAANTADVNILRIGTDNRLEITAYQHVVDTVALNNNQVTATDITDVNLSTSKVRTAVIEYGVYRQGTSNLSETGLLHLAYNGTTWEIAREHTGNAGLGLSITAAGQLQYTTTDLAGHTASNFYFIIRSLGV